MPSRLLDVPHTAREMAEFLSMFELSVPNVRACDCHDTPMDYLLATVHGKENCIVQANRGGGKTKLTALGALLCAADHPCETAILGGSQLQSSRVADYIRQLLRYKPDLAQDKATTSTRITLTNESVIHVLAQSETAVRGLHADRIRADELEMFDPQVWEAVNFATSGKNGRMDITSTFHKAGGLMGKLIDQAESGRYPGRLFKWCLREVLAPCRCACKTCPLEPDCRGVAKRGQGHVTRSDAIDIKARVSADSWKSEMMCLRPSKHHLVFPEFAPSVHVKPGLAVSLTHDTEADRFLGVDFGYVNPFVALQLQVTANGVVNVTGEYSVQRETMESICIALRSRVPYARIAYVDPAGNSPGPVSGSSPVEVMRSYGFSPRWTHSTISTGLDYLRSLLSPALGRPGLLVDPACTGLIRALQEYHFGAKGLSEEPEKDGPDHWIDALRYALCGLHRKAAFRSY